MGVHVIKLPDIGEGIAEVELVAWHVKVGDTVVEDQVLADVMTDKATVEIPSPVAGKVLALGGEVGDVMAVGSRADPHRSRRATGQARTRRRRRAIGRAPAAAAAAPARAGRAGHAAGATPTPVAAPAPSQRRPRDRAQRPIASPAVVRRAWELGIDLRDVAGTGPPAGSCTPTSTHIVARSGARAPAAGRAARAPATDATRT